MSLCAGCRRPLSGDQTRAIPAALALLASFALAMAHGGMWAKTELARPYCARCRRRVALFALLLAGVMGGVAAFGLHLWLTMPAMPK